MTINCNTNFHHTKHILLLDVATSSGMATTSCSSNLYMCKFLKVSWLVQNLPTCLTACYSYVFTQNIVDRLKIIVHINTKLVLYLNFGSYIKKMNVLFPPSFFSATLCQQCQWVLLCLWLLSVWQHECSCLLYLPIPASVCDVTIVPSCGSTEVCEVITLCLPELNIYIMLVSFYGGYCCFAYASSLPYTCHQPLFAACISTTVSCVDVKF